MEIKVSNFWTVMYNFLTAKFVNHLCHFHPTNNKKNEIETNSTKQIDRKYKL